MLDNESIIWIRLVFAFIPASFGELSSQLPVQKAILWTPITYSFLHADWSHLFVNLFWMVAFGSPVAKRFGAFRFSILFIACAIGGAGMHYLFYSAEAVPMIGASGAVSGFMGAAARFAFTQTRQFDPFGPALGLIESFKNKQVLIFLIVWMVLNFIFGANLVSIAGENTNIAWQAHIGGFVTGILIFAFLDPKQIKNS